MRLHVIIDSLDVADAALRAGAPVVQVRALGLTDGALLELAGAVTELARAAGATCIVDNRADVAVAAGADGVHVGPDDLPVEVVRRIVGPDAIVGASARSPERARHLAAAGATYIGCGPCYATASKAGLPAPIGLGRLTEVAAAVDVPVVGIGGITVTTAADVIAAGAAGVAVIGAVSAAADPVAATRALLAAVAAPTTRA